MEAPDTDDPIENKRKTSETPENTDKELSDAEKSLDLLNSIEDPEEFQRKMREYGETVEESDA